MDKLDKEVHRSSRHIDQLIRYSKYIYLVANVFMYIYTYTFVCKYTSFIIWQFFSEKIGFQRMRLGQIAGFACRRKGRASIVARRKATSFVDLLILLSWGGHWRTQHMFL